MGVLDLPAPLFAWVDNLMTSLPTVVRLVLWGVAAGAFSMWLYRKISPQDRIARSRQEQLDARRRLDEFDGELTEAWPLIRRLLALSGTQVGRVLGPAVLASLPVLCLLVWMSTAYGHAYPDEPPRVHVTPSSLEARWIPAPGHPPRIRVTGSEPVVVPLAAPVPVIEKRHWWNALIGNPAGYLEENSPVERLDIELPRREFVNVGPGWMRGWEMLFFVSLLAASLVLKRLLRIH